MGLEVVVRPLVIPNIRPSAPRVMAPPDDPTQGLCVISGGGGKFIGTSISSSSSVSKQLPHQETKRQVDVERVYQVDDNGNANMDNFIDVERMKKVQLKSPDGNIANREYASEAGPPPNRILKTNITNIRTPADDG